MAVPIAVTAVRNFLSGTFVPGAAETSRIAGYDASLTGNPNELALLLNLIFPLSLGLFLISRKLLARTLLLGVMAVDVLAVILTFSRAGFLTLVTIALMYLWKLRGQAERGWVLAALLIALLSVPLLPSGYLDRLATIADTQSDPTGSAQARRSDTLAALSFVGSNPIVGAGVGMNALALNEQRGQLWTVVHNVYLEYAVELGIPGLVLFLWLLANCFKATVDVQRNCAGVPALRELFHLAQGIQISLIAFAVAGLFHPGGYNFYFYYMAGLALAARAVFEVERRRRS